MRKTMIVLFAIAVAAWAHADGGHRSRGQETAFGGVFEHYEAVRQALLHDHMDGVADHARHIRKAAEHLGEKFTANQAGVDSSKAAECRALLPDVEAAAKELEKADRLEAARGAFYALSKPLARWREMARGERPVVVYCAMAKKSWLQPEGEIGNPYYGQSMARCGEVVSK